MSLVQSLKKKYKDISCDKEDYRLDTKSSSGVRLVTHFGLVGEDDASQDDCFRLAAHLGKNCLAYDLHVFLKDLRFRNVMLQIKAENLEQ